jgi:hypothetical protein
VSQSVSWRNLLNNVHFFLMLLRLDQDRSKEIRAEGCPYCGSTLHYARYERKPRGGPAGLPAAYDRRDSLCCSADGCRRRVLPPSLRFFGRRVYLGAVFVLVSAIIHGITEKRAAELYAMVGVTIRTLARWRKWWREVFPNSVFWHGGRARFMPPPDESLLPASLLECFHQPRKSELLLAVLKFLAPLGSGRYR